MIYLKLEDPSQNSETRVTVPLLSHVFEFQKQSKRDIHFNIIKEIFKWMNYPSSIYGYENMFFNVSIN